MLTLDELKEEELLFKNSIIFNYNQIEYQNTPWNLESIVSNFYKDNMKILVLGFYDLKFFATLNILPQNITFVFNNEKLFNHYRDRIVPLGYKVSILNNGFLDINIEYDLIINKFKIYNILEINRVLKKTGIFITEQNGFKNNELLSKLFDPRYKTKIMNNDLNHNFSITKEYFTIVYSDECYPYIRFKDIKDLLNYIIHNEDEFPNFSIDKNYSDLSDIDQVIKINRYIESFLHKFIIVAKKV